MRWPSRGKGPRPGDRWRLVARANDRNFKGKCDGGSALAVVKTAKVVTGEERKLSGYLAVRPAAPGALNGKGRFVAFVAKDDGRDFLLNQAGAKPTPRIQELLIRHDRRHTNAPLKTNFSKSGPRTVGVCRAMTG
jgi:hypothetical protein